MVFNSYIFIFLFLPIVIAGYFFCNKSRHIGLANLFLLVVSLFFYGYWNPIYLPLILMSITVNYCLGLLTTISAKKKLILSMGILFNVGLLGFFKYSDFFIANINIATNANVSLLRLILPLGISFFTFTQIAFLVDVYKKKVKEVNFLNYALFVTYFPHLLAGPILHHAQMMPQLANKTNRVINYRNLVLGLMIFAIGLFKKTCIADTLAEWVGYGYASIPFLTTVEAWLLTFCYTFQLYFDFSGYTDMAIGCSLMLNIKLPENFNSPYKALDIRDFWQRWHMTLSHWLKEYIYIPLGGNRRSELQTHCNLILTFLIGGFWHGAGWTFVIWGLLHGLAMSINRLWKNLNIRLPGLLAWLITFLFVNFAWIFFRSESSSQAISLIKKMFQPMSLSLPNSFMDFLYHHSMIHLTLDHRTFFIFLAFFTYICFAAKNSIELRLGYTASLTWNLFIALVLAGGILSLNRVTTFIYFQF